MTTVLVTVFPAESVVRIADVTDDETSLEIVDDGVVLGSVCVGVVGIEDDEELEDELLELLEDELDVVDEEEVVDDELVVSVGSVVSVGPNYRDNGQTIIIKEKKVENYKNVLQRLGSHTEERANVSEKITDVV